MWLVIFLSLCRKDNTEPPRVRASWRNPDPYGRQAGTWRLDKAEVKGLWVKGQERRPDVEAEERRVHHLRSFCLLLINCLSFGGSCFWVWHFQHVLNPSSSNMAAWSEAIKASNPGLLVESPVLDPSNHPNDLLSQTFLANKLEGCLQKWCCRSNYSIIIRSVGPLTAVIFDAFRARTG